MDDVAGEVVVRVRGVEADLVVRRSDHENFRRSGSIQKNVRRRAPDEKDDDHDHNDRK